MATAVALAAMAPSPLSGQPLGAPSIPRMHPYKGAVQNAGDPTRPFFIVDTKGLWPTTQIEVCWEPRAEAFGKEQAIVRAAVGHFIEGNSQFRFPADWGICDQNMRPRIRIQILDKLAESEVGYQKSHSLVGPGTPRPTTMSMNFTFQNWNKDCAKTEPGREQCIATIAVHEFLHALGALHEQLSPSLKTENPACWARYRDAIDYSTDSQRSLTAYDPDSIMNYCHDIYSLPTHLSDLDKTGLSQLSALTISKQADL